MGSGAVRPLPLDLGDVTRLSDALTGEYLEEHRLVPTERRNGAVVVACADQPDPQALSELSEVLGAPLELVRAPEQDIVAAVRRAYGADPGTAADLIAGLEPDLEADTIADGAVAHDLAALANQPPVVRLVNLLLSEAVGAGASDVHLEADERRVRVRYRVDGVLDDAPSPPGQLRHAMLSRLKIMAELDIAERRAPQDGRFRLRMDDRELDVRVSTLPTLHGESVVLRLLDATREARDLASLGMAQDTLAALSGFARRPQGVLLVTGPTGSGKTTTLYALVQHLATGREKIVSVEDPVEYQLAGVSQVPVQPRAGVTFARALRSILRHDPDVLLVGEMRDPETAEICTQAALTGHLVLSTLHTTDAPAALTRLVDLGVAPYLVTSTVEMVLAQRLVRLLCRACASPMAATDSVRALAADDGCEIGRVMRAVGCAECRGTGYRGRSGIYELLVVDERLRREVSRGQGADVLRRLALASGMRSLRADGWRLVGMGRTTPEEVLRVTAAAVPSGPDAGDLS